MRVWHPGAGEKMVGMENAPCWWRWHPTIENRVRRLVYDVYAWCLVREGGWNVKNSPSVTFEDHIRELWRCSLVPGTWYLVPKNAPSWWSVSLLKIMSERASMFLVSEVGWTMKTRRIDSGSTFPLIKMFSEWRGSLTQNHGKGNLRKMTLLCTWTMGIFYREAICFLLKWVFGWGMEAPKVRSFRKN